MVAVRGAVEVTAPAVDLAAEQDPAEELVLVLVGR